MLHRLLVLAVLSPFVARAQEPIDWNPGADTFTISSPELGWSADLATADLDSLTVANFTPEPGQRLTFLFLGLRDSLRIAPDEPGVYRVRLGGAGRPVLIDLALHPEPSARFTEAHRRQYASTSRTEVPEVYELVNVVIALTPSGRAADNPFVRGGGLYHDRVMAHFGPFADHPLVAEMEHVVSSGDYVAVRSNAYAFDFDGDRVVPDPTYQALSYNKLHFDALVPLLEAFAADSGFRSFYAANRDVYDGQARALERLTPVRQMWDWLETEYPTRVDGYVTIASPLTHTVHNIVRIENDGYLESIIFASTPPLVADPSVDGEAETWQEVEMSQAVFTEYDHAYVNPSIEPLGADINDAMADLDMWNRQSDYRSGVETFAEYMTWAVFVLYVEAHYAPDVAARARRETVHAMDVRRGFSQFGPFLDALTVLYDARGEGETLTDLTPALVRWVGRQ